MDFIKIFAGGFPLTKERLEFLQETYKNAFAQFSTILGSGTHYILDGVNTAGGSLTDGVVVINGEIMPFVGGAFDGTTVTIQTDFITVPYNEDVDGDGNLDQKQADTYRLAKPLEAGDDTGENHLYSLFVRVPKIIDIMPRIGDVKLIARNYDPAVDIGWEVLPMGDRFPIGAGVSHSVNAVGGSNTQTLTEAQMPAHTHAGTVTLPAHTHSLQGKTAITHNGEGGDGNRLSTSNNIGHGEITQTSSGGGGNANLTTNSKGNSQPFSIKPSFRAFNYLIFVGV